MKGTCFRIMLLLIICANVMFFVGYERASACHPHISSSAADARCAHIQGPHPERYTHPNKVSGLW